MNKSALSVFVFGLYLVLLGIILVVAPNSLLVPFFLPSTTEVWIRVIGVVVIFMAFYYIQAARTGMTNFFRWTVYARPTLIVFFTVFVLLGYADPPLILFGVVDLLGAIWTGLALKSSKTPNKESLGRLTKRHSTGGILRHFQALSTPKQNHPLRVLSTSAHLQLTPAVGWQNR